MPLKKTLGVNMNAQLKKFIVDEAWRCRVSASVLAETALTREAIEAAAAQLRQQKTEDRQRLIAQITE